MSAARLLTTDRLVTAAVDWAPAWVEVSGDRVTAAGHGERDGGEHLAGVLVPGFVDGHAHGALGHDFSSATAEEAATAAAFHHRSGTTSLVASIATAPFDTMVGQVALLADLVDDGTLAGLHLEGPYLSVERRGAHNPALLRTPDPAEADRLLDAGRGTIRVVTVAPELPGAEALVRRFVAAGVVVAIGHSACDAATATAALDWGARMVTHTFNGMPPIGGRAPGLAGVALGDARAHLEFIDDGQHLDPATIRLIRHAAAGRAGAVSDAMAAIGLADGAYEVAGSAVTVRDGVARTEEGSLAGSVSTLAVAAALLIGSGADIPEVVRLTSAGAAEALGLRDTDPTTGGFADLVQLVPDGDGMRVARVLRRGEWLPED